MKALLLYLSYKGDKFEKFRKTRIEKKDKKAGTFFAYCFHSCTCSLCFAYMGKSSTMAKYFGFSHTSFCFILYFYLCLC